MLGLDFSSAPVVSGTQTVDGATLAYAMVDMKHGYRAYTISGDQRYQLADTQRAGYYYARFDGANVPLNHTIVVGAQSYYRISFNHRYLYVRTTDVTLG